MCTYIVCMYICMCISVYVHMYVHVCILVYARVNIIFVRHICDYLYMSVPDECVYVRVYVQYVCACMDIYVCIDINCVRYFTGYLHTPSLLFNSAWFLCSPEVHIFNRYLQRSVETIVLVRDASERGNNEPLINYWFIIATPRCIPR